MECGRKTSGIFPRHIKEHVISLQLRLAINVERKSHSVLFGFFMMFTNFRFHYCLSTLTELTHHVCCYGRPFVGGDRIVTIPRLCPPERYSSLPRFPAWCKSFHDKLNSDVLPRRRIIRNKQRTGMGALATAEAMSAWVESRVANM